MIISDLQYIESANEAEVQGAGYKYSGHNYYYSKYKAPVNTASADAGATAIGKNTFTSTSTGATVISGVASESGSSSFATSF